MLRCRRFSPFPSSPLPEDVEQHRQNCRRASPPLPSKPLPLSRLYNKLPSFLGADAAKHLTFEALHELLSIRTLDSPITERSGHGPANPTAAAAVVQTVISSLPRKRSGAYAFGCGVATLLTTTISKLPTVFSFHSRGCFLYEVFI